MGGIREMPNWVKNRVEISGPEKDKVDAVLLLKSNQDESCFDFNNIIPMPHSLKIESGSYSMKSLAVYRYKVMGVGTAALEKFKSYDEEAINMTLDDYADQLLKDGSADLELGRTVYSNIEKYGYGDWYDWSISKWGTKWNACDADCYKNHDGNIVYEFNTAWSAPTPVIEQLAKRFPNLTIHHVWADEDMGNNTGEVTYQGDAADWNYHQDGSSEAYRIYIECWGDTDCIDQDEDGNYYARTCEKCGKCC
jgi:hypothetical protein